MVFGAVQGNWPVIPRQSRRERWRNMDPTEHLGLLDDDLDDIQRTFIEYLEEQKADRKLNRQIQIATLATMGGAALTFAANLVLKFL